MLGCGKDKPFRREGQLSSEKMRLTIVPVRCASMNERTVPPRKIQIPLSALLWRALCRCLTPATRTAPQEGGDDVSFLAAARAAKARQEANKLDKSVQQKVPVSSP